MKVRRPVDLTPYGRRLCSSDRAAFCNFPAINLEKEISAMKKKFLALALTAVMALSLAACGGDTQSTDTDA